MSNRFKRTTAAVTFLSLTFCFATVAHAVSIEYALVDDAGNTSDARYDTIGYGSVSYNYSIGKYEVNNAQYAEFLNAVANDDPYGLYDTNMGGLGGGWNEIGGITRSGAPGSYTYTTRINRGNRPVNWVSWYDTLRFANWLHNGQPTGVQGPNTTEDGAYNMSLGSSVVRKPGALVFLPSEDEWYKAAYYKGGGLAAGYWDYPTGSNTAPSRQPPPGGNMTDGSANFYFGHYLDTIYYTTEVGAYDAKPSDSPYGTFDQGGNLWEWNEAIISDSARALRGGSLASDSGSLHAASRSLYYPSNEYYLVGFRVATINLPDAFASDADMASIPEPSTLLLGSLASLGMLIVNPHSASIRYLW